MPKPLDVIEKIGDFITKFTGSSYEYTEPTGKINDNYEKIGEILGFPVYIDTGKGYENEFLDFPSLGDILSTLTPAVSYSVNASKCTVCLSINYQIPLIKYPPIIICLAKPECKEKQDKNDWYDKECLTEEDLDVLHNLPPEELLQINVYQLPAPCSPRPPVPDIPPPKPGDYYLRQARAWWDGEDVSDDPTGWYFHDYNNFDPEQAPDRREVFRYNFNGRSQGCDVVEWRYSYYTSVGNAYHHETNSGGISYSFQDCPVFAEPRVLFASGKGNSVAQLWIQRFSDGFVFKPEDPPPPPEIPDPPPMEECCEELKKILARIERVVRETKKEVGEAHKVLNPKQFFKKEIQIPSNWIYPGNEGNPVILEDYPDLISAVARLVDRRTGWLPQLVRIKDADPTKEGEQQVDLVVNSLADATRLILEYLLQNHGNIGGIQMMSAANLYEAGITHQIAVSMWNELQAISEFLDYDTKQRAEKFKMAFNPKLKVDEKNPETLEKLLPKFLKHTTQEVEVNEFKGGKTLKDIVNDIKKDTANIAAGITRKLSEHSLDDLIEETQNIERLKRQLQVKEFRDREGIADLKEFFDDAELGYPSSDVSLQKKDKPYGFQSTDKPKMKVTTKKSRKPKYKK